MLDDDMDLAELTADMGSQLLRSQPAWERDSTAEPRSGCLPESARGGAACAPRAGGLA